MAGKCRAIIEDHIFDGIKGNALAVWQLDIFSLSYFLNNRVNTVRLNGIGRFPGEAQHKARSVPWPLPVKASEPWSDTVTRAAFSALAFDRKRRAATMGPTVWELDGPMPILKSSKTERNIQLTVR